MLQRDFEADGGLTPILEDRALDLRRRALDAIAAVFEELELGAPTPAMKASVRDRLRLRRDRELHARARWQSSPRRSSERGIDVVDVIKALAARGFREEAENLLWLVKLRVSGDYLQTSAMVRDGHVVSAVNDPNDYLGPGTGYRVTEARRQEIQRASATCSTARRCWRRRTSSRATPRPPSRFADDGPGRGRHRAGARW